MDGFVHSIESFGTVDGPGIRLVVFLKGCPLRCLYCHNPDTWAMQGATVMTEDEILAQYKKNRQFYQNGGITVTGGEPLLQAEFVAKLFEKANKEGIHTCLDTSGIIFDQNTASKIDALLDFCDLVMLDLKHIDPVKHKALTGSSNENILAFAKHLKERNIPVWIRTVIVPGVTDTPEDLVALGEFIGTLDNVKALDVLPYHTMGKEKYKSLGMEYPLGEIPPATKAKASMSREFIIEGIKSVRS